MTTRIRINGADYVGWEGLTASRSVEDSVSTCSFTSPLRWPNDPNPVRVRPGDSVELYDDNDKMLTGYADAITIDSEPDGDTVAIDARSRTADLADCSCVTEPFAWKQKVMLSISRLLALPYDISVLDETGGTYVSTRPIDFKVDIGETVFEAIERMARDAAVIVTDNGNGDIVFTKGVLDNLPDLPTLEYGVNVKSASGTFRHDERFSDYRVYGQRQGSNADFGGNVSSQRVIVTDPEVSRNRVLSMQSTQRANLDQLKSLATWEAITRAGRSVALTYTVVGWRRPDGALWAPGQLALVKDRVRAVDSVMLVTTVTWQQSGDSKTAVLALAPTEGFEFMPTITESSKQALTKTVTPGASFGVWLTAAEVAEIKARSGK